MRPSVHFPLKFRLTIFQSESPRFRSVWTSRLADKYSTPGQRSDESASDRPGPARRAVRCPRQYRSRPSLSAECRLWVGLGRPAGVGGWIVGVRGPASGVRRTAGGGRRAVGGGSLPWLALPPTAPRSRQGGSRARGAGGRATSSR